jgi:hypothetical protein
LDSNDVFLDKTKQSVVALKNLVDEDLIDANYVRLAKVAKKMNALKLDWLATIFYNTFKDKIEKKLCSENPSMFLFDVYRLSYYCTLSQSKKKQDESLNH